nr:endonuclease/exonuclease/phosphatase family domain-containing protein 1-like isoform X2 [Geotrypetes seraphini]
MQQVLEELAIEKICKEIETPSILALKDWPSPRGSWRYIIPECDDGAQEVERVAFMWDTTSGLELVNAITLETELVERGQQIHCKPLFGHFKIDKLNFKLLNIYLKPGKTEDISCSSAVHLQGLKPYLKEDAHVLVMGNLGSELESSAISLLQDCGFQQCIQVNMHTTGKGNILPQNTKTTRNETDTAEQDGTLLQNLASSNPSQQNINYRETENPSSNIWSSCLAQAVSTGHWGMIQDRLRSPNISDCSSTNGVFSQYCPFWVEFYRQ